MKRILKDINIKMISLVRAGANQKEIIYKGESLQSTLRVDFLKSNEEQGVVYGIVYAPNETDTQGDSTTTDEILKAAYKFMKNSNLTQCVDVEHSLNPVEAYICESWIVKTRDPFFSEVGAWAVGIKLEDDNLKEAVKNGEINGLSMYGSGVVETEWSETKKSLAETIKDVLKSIFGENLALAGKEQSIQKQEETMSEDQIKELVKSSVDTAIADVKKSYEEKLEAQSKQIADLEAEINKSKQHKEPKEVIKSATGGIL